jgi:hypothetical protein
LSCVKIVYKPMNIIIALQVKCECRLLIKTVVCIENCNVEEIVIHDFDNRRNTDVCLSNVTHSYYREKDPVGVAPN